MSPDNNQGVNLKNLLLITLFTFFLCSCSGSNTYSIGALNNTEHTPIKLKIQYPSPDGMKRVRFSMIDIGEFKSNYLDTKNNPVPKEVKLSWINAKGKKLNEVIDLSHIPPVEEESAIIFHINQSNATAVYYDKDQFSSEWEKRLERKGYK